MKIKETDIVVELDDFKKGIFTKDFLSELNNYISVFMATHGSKFPAKIVLPIRMIYGIPVTPGKE